MSVCRTLQAGFVWAVWSLHLARVSLLGCVNTQERSGGSSSASQAGLAFPQGQVNEFVLRVALDTWNEATSCCS